MPSTLTQSTAPRASASPEREIQTPERRVPESTVSLADLPTGSTGIFSHSDLNQEQRAYMSAIGLTPASTVRVCKAGQPCVVEVRTTRVGIAHNLARQLFVSVDQTDSPPQRSTRLA